MKKLMVIVLVVTVLAMFSGIALAVQDETGHGAPSGSHYNLNIIGMQHDKNDDMGCGSGHRIFVDLGKNGAVKTRINLTQGDFFAVLDCNGTDGVAEFQLPAPATGDENVPTLYEVWIRVPGNPKGSATIGLCGEGTDAGGTWVYACNAVVELPTEKGKKFMNVTRELLYLQGFGWIFSEAWMDYFWEYNNSGLKLVQIRLYPKDPI